jgi:tyrosinase
VYGFGGNGANGSVPGVPPNSNETVGSCIADGPFANTTYSLGPGFQLVEPDPHCLVRDFNASLFDASGQWEKNVVPLLAETEFFNFSLKFSIPQTGAPAGIHGAGHSGTGGEVRSEKFYRESPTN